MTAFVALLRAVNVGGTGKLPMAALRAACAASGFTDVRTYIASGNAVFTALGDETAVRKALDVQLRPALGPRTGILVRTAAEMAAIRDANPFADAPGNRTVAIILDEPPTADALATLRGRVDEDVRLGRREIYVYYPSGMGTSTLTIPAAKAGTGRNMNTIAKLAAMAAAL